MGADTSVSNVIEFGEECSRLCPGFVGGSAGGILIIEGFRSVGKDTA